MAERLLEVRGLWNHRLKHAGVHALGEPVDIDLDAGEILCLSGPSGSGKTLLLRALADLDPSTGVVLLDGKAREAVPGHVWRRRVVYVAAEAAWWAPVVGAHLEASTSAVGALGFGPTILDRKLVDLSTGERQRLGVLRALSVGPRVLLLDEPTAALDALATRRVEAAVRDYLHGSGAGAIWVSHSAQQIERLGNRHFIIADGALRPAESETQARHERH